MCEGGNRSAKQYDEPVRHGSAVHFFLAKYLRGALIYVIGVCNSPLLILAIIITLLRRQSVDEGGNRSAKQYDEPVRRGSAAHFFLEK